jgi:hypothetical protein
MPRIDDQIKGLQFVQKLQGRAVLNLNKVKADFIALSSPEAQRAAIDALKTSGDTMLQGLASGLERAMSAYEPPKPSSTYVPRTHSAG